MSQIVPTRLANTALRTCWPGSAFCLQSLAVFLLQLPDFSDLYNSKKNSVYNVLWVLVFGFATLNILGLVLRRFDPRRSGLNFGELQAITVTCASVLLLGLEMLNLFHVFPIKLQPR
jgi:cytosine/uracil/thiamine/allantoin permease